MLVYKQVFEKLKEKGFSSYRLAQEKLIEPRTQTRIRNGESVSTNTIDKICGLLDCQPNDILEYKKSGTE